MEKAGLCDCDEIPDSWLQRLSLVIMNQGSSCLQFAQRVQLAVNETSTSVVSLSCSTMALQATSIHRFLLLSGSNCLPLNKSPRG